MPASDADSRGPPRTSPSPPPIKITSQGKLPPVLPFFPFTKVSGCHPFTTGYPPVGSAIGRFLLHSGSSLPSTSFALGIGIIGPLLRRPTQITRATSVAAGEVSSPCFPSPVRHCLMSAALVCSSGAELGAPSPT
jgi:hypothetical protein